MDNIKELLKQRLNCSENESETLYEDLTKLDSTLVPILDNWISDENALNDTDYNGYSVALLCEKFGMTFVGAILTIDWIIKDPEKALEALKNGII